MRNLALVAASAAVVKVASATEVDTPAFTPSSVKGFFVEQFADDSWNERWSPSEAVKEGYQGKETMQYNGQWSVEEPTIFPGLTGDKGLVVKTKAAHHAISVPFPNTLDPATVDASADQAFVVQYEVKLQKGLDCGGAYLKLLTESEQGIHAQEFSDKTPYTVMFGPDKCGGTQKTHLIIRHKNPITGEFEEKHLKNPPAPKSDKVTNLYTLILKPNQTYEIKINDESAKTGSLLEDFEPPFNPPKEIDDPEDKKPEDWVDNPKMLDPEATKPDDWDEDAPMEIPDEEAEKPEGWLDDEAPMIPDPETEKPEEWDDDEDGDWVAPLVPNPKCEDAPGCGEWVRPQKANPDYKGKWYAPFIDNPEYKGPWAPAKTPNPDYFEDNEPAKLNRMAGIGIELWTMTDDILFDNFYVGFSPSEAETFAKETFHVKRPIEDAKLNVDKKAKEEEDPFAPKPFAEDPVGFIRSRLQMFLNVAVVDPLAAFKSMPEIGASIAGAFILLVGLFGALISILIPAPKAAKTDKKKTDAPTKDAAADKASKDAPIAGKKEEETTGGAKKRSGKK